MKFYSAWNRKTLSLRQYAAIVDSSDDAIIGQTPDGIITGWNPAAVRLFGHSAAEAVGNPIAMIYPPDRLDEGADLLRRIATGETIARFDSVRVRKNASVVDVSVTLAPITDGRGRIIGALNLAHDISARLQSEQSLRHYAAIVESADDAIVGKTLDGTITSWNAGAERIFGFSRGEALGAPISIIIPELFAAEEYALLQRIHDGEPIQHYQTIRRHKNGRLLDISVSVSPIRDHRGQIVGACKIARNLNDATLQANHRLLDATVTVLRPGLQSFEAELQNPAVRRSEEFLARVGRIAGVGGWEIDLVTRQPIWSAEARRIHGVAADYRPTLDSALEFFPPEALPSIIAAIEKSRQTGEGWDLELPLQRADGHRIWVRTVGETAFTGGQPVRVSGTIQDITDLVRERQAREEASERLSLATESGNIAIWDWDLVNRFVHWDPRMYRLHGIEPGSGVETYDQSVRAIHPDDIDAVKQMLRHAVRAGGTFDCEFRVVWPDDSIHYIKGLARVHRDADGRAIRMIGTNWDITEARRLAAKTAEQAEFLRVTLESIADAVMTCDAAGDITWLNPVAARMTGWPCSEALGRPLTEVCSIVTEETRLAVPNAAAICLAGAREVASTSHTLLIGRDGSAFGIDYTASPIRNDSGRVIGAVLVCHDVSEQQRLSREMSHRASHDGLTGLINRAAFDTRLSRLLRERKDEPHVMLYIDLDTFKVVNEACGHDAGDQLLRQISGLLSELVRTRDCVARLGGDEFGVLLERCSLSAGHQIAQKICDQIELFRFAWDGRRFRIGASIGVVPIDQRWDNAAAAVKAADSSCHAAKESGRHRVHVWEESDDRMKARQSEAQWVNRLESAMEDDRFILYGQRILPIDGPMRALHCEVLLRLKDVDGTLVLPSAFMPAAERFHLASRIDRWVLGRVFAQLSLPGAAMDRIETIAVNLSGQSMGDRRFQQDVIRMVGSAGFDVRKLCFEITETVAITNFAEAQRFIDEVRAFGVQIALDDFGAGASSFGYLRKLAVDVLKIDGQFITGLLDNPLDNAAVRCFCEVAKVVGAKTIAEFVERADVRQALCRLGVDMAQGYLMHRPEPLIGLLPRAA